MSTTQQVDGDVTQAVMGDCHNSNQTINFFNFISYVPLAEEHKVDATEVETEKTDTPQYVLSEVERNAYVSELIKFHEQHPRFKKILQQYAVNAVGSTFYRELDNYQLLNLVGFKNLLVPTLKELIKHKDQATKQTELNKKYKAEIEQYKKTSEHQKNQTEALKSRYESGLIKGILNICTKPK